jgi:hypothetical protein
MRVRDWLGASEVRNIWLVESSRRFRQLTPSPGASSPCSVVFIAAPFRADTHGRCDPQGHLAGALGVPGVSLSRGSTG